MWSCGVQCFVSVLFALVVVSLVVSSADLSSLSGAEFLPSRRTRHAIMERLITEVNPTEVTLAEGSEVEVECRASWRGRRVPDDITNVHFNWWVVNNTVLPLSSRLPGVEIRTVSDDYTSDDSAERSESVRILTIGPSMYNILPRGLSRFSCSALSPRNGHSEAVFFYVHKV